MPDVKDYRLNKYGLPSYIQLNAQADYNFKGKLKAMKAQFLYVYNQRIGKVYSPASLMNRVNMSLFNLELNYRF